MSGHSKWATTHRQKEAADAKKGAVFTKLGNLITIAAKEGGGDMVNNFKLRLAIDKARTQNMPKDKIEKAVKRGTGELAGEAALEEVVYEAFGPAGSAFVVEAITNNKNRTVSEIKNILNKNGGQLAGPNSVLWLFERRGQIIIGVEELAETKAEEIELALIDLGAEDIDRQTEAWQILAPVDQLQKIEQGLKHLDLKIKESGLIYTAKNQLIINDAAPQEKIEKLFLALEDCEEVNNVYTNAEW